MLGALLVVGIGLIVYIWVLPFIAQDACLDGGGAWNDGQCRH
jgi:hypothetical protein